MAKKKTTRSRKNSRKQQPVPQHELPNGFWSQVAAITLIAFSILLIVSWFGGGGQFLNWVRDASLDVIGLATYVLPVISIYVAVQVFKVENNKLPAIMKFASLLLIIWFSGLFGLFRQEHKDSTGGVIGDALNGVMTGLVNVPVGVFIYVLLIVITLLFVLRLSFDDVGSMVKRAVGRGEKSEDEAGVTVIRKASTVDKPMSDFKLNAGVPTLSPEDRKKARLASLKNSVKPDKDAEEKAAMLAVSDPNWKFPNVELLEKKQSPADAGDIQQNAHIIQDTLREFSIDVEMEGANIGPKVTQYTLKPPAGIKLSRITALETNIALNLAASSLRMEAPIPGQKAVGIEVPNKKAADVRIRGILDSPEWRKVDEPLAFAVGKDISGLPVVGELNKMPHLLIAGQTGSGKSVMINTLLCSLLYRNAPSDMKLILVDPKQVEMAPYQDIPHLLTPVIVEPEKTISALKWAVNEMERRYSLLAEEKVRDIKSYNEKVKNKTVGVEDEDGNIQQVDEGHMPYIVIVIDELSDLMMVAARDVEALVVRIAQKARAVGIHLVLATQRPSVDVITGLIKANIPARIAFTVASQVDSRTILDQAGAEKLLGQGDMLMKTAAMPKPKRIQGAWVMDSEVNKITDHLRMQSAPHYNDEIVSQPVQLNGKGGVVMNFDHEGGDDMFKDAVRVVLESRKASTSLLQRKLRVGYARAARIVEEMEEQGIIGPADGARPREVLIHSMDDLDGASSVGTDD
ncbi:DNA translocase FtsK 4TM domain-containing protein [Candidatus Saccharibacteria bacterium]|nr:DNA translocase FtsK 4TM domain-containing protein [Candidatus Saccharibacteria bacterium]